jgi:hypothetical protein
MDLLLEEKESVEPFRFEFAMRWWLVEVDRLAVRGTVVELEPYRGCTSADLVEELFVMVQMPSALFRVALHRYAC